MNPVVEGRPGVGLGQTQQDLLLALKRRGPSTTHDLAEALGLASATVREHLQSLAERALVERAGVRRAGAGRPQVVYRLAPGAEAVFPRGEGAVLRDLTRHLLDHGQADVLVEVMRDRIAARRPAALERVAGLSGPDRLAEVARILTEEGYMAELGPGDAGPVLRLCHCPLRALVAVTRAPCQAEIEFIEELLGQSLSRVEFLPQGGTSCSYSVGGWR